MKRRRGRRKRAKRAIPSGMKYTLTCSDLPQANPCLDRPMWPREAPGLPGERLAPSCFLLLPTEQAKGDQIPGHNRPH